MKDMVMKICRQAFHSIPADIASREVAISLALFKQEIQIALEAVSGGDLRPQTGIEPRQPISPQMDLAKIMVFGMNSRARLAKKRDQLDLLTQVSANRRKIEVPAIDKISDACAGGDDVKRTI